MSFTNLVDKNYGKLCIQRKDLVEVTDPASYLD